jgi:hypothetical protein
MSLSITLDGNLNIQLTEESRPMPVPMRFGLNYTRKNMNDFVYLGAVTNQVVPQGTVTNPTLVLVWVREGAISLAWNVGGQGPTDIAANPTPPPTDPPQMMLTRYAPGPGQLYITTTGPARGAIWVFQ